MSTITTLIMLWYLAVPLWLYMLDQESFSKEFSNIITIPLVFTPIFYKYTRNTFK